MTEETKTPLEGGGVMLDRGDLRWLTDLIQEQEHVGHCGEGTLERKTREAHNARLQRVLAAIAASQARQRELEEALRDLAAELDRAATDRQAWADHPGIGGNKPRFASHLRGKRCGYSHAAQLIRALLNSPAGEQPEGWVLVPREPTEAMETAGAEMHGETEGFGLTQQVELVYRAMIFAAPSPTGGER